MMYVLILPMCICLCAFFIFRAALDEKKKDRLLREQLFRMWGNLPEGYEIGKAKRTDVLRADQKQSEHSLFIDEITWNDLSMDTVFARLDYTRSQAGAAYLYRELHCPVEEIKSAEKREHLIAYFTENAEKRVEIQMLLSKIGWYEPQFLEEYLTDITTEKRKGLWKEYAVNALYFAAVLIAFYRAEMGLCMLLALSMYQIASYFQRRAKILPRIRCVAGILHMAECIEKLVRVMDAEFLQMTEDAYRGETKPSVSDCAKEVGSLKKNSFWILQCGRENSSPLSLLCDYIRMLFHADLIQYAQMERQLLLKKGEILKAAGIIGFVDSTISIALFRSSLMVWCAPKIQKDAEEIVIREGMHPLLEHPMANSIRVSRGRGVLLTGSNASGKSTFLKMAAVNILLAQTIHTAQAKELVMPLCQIYTSLQAQDNIEKGDSSYVAEVRSLKRIMDAAERKAFPVVCFVDEILRGTNTLERIAASAEILQYFQKEKIYCFAATHDRELTQILEKEYENYYFTEEIKDGDIVFPYRLLAGSAAGGNAIRLLEVIGYAPEITQGAKSRAEKFRKERSWK